MSAQSRLTQGVETRVAADSLETLARFIDALDPNLHVENLPRTTEFFHKVASDIEPVIDTAQNCWKRPRPFVTNAKIHPFELVTDLGD